MALAPHSTASVAQALEGIDFPVNKTKLVEYARNKKADPEVVKVIEGMPEEEYTSMADVFKGVGMSN